MERGLLRVDEAAAYLGLGRSKTYELIQAGALPVVRIGRAARVPLASLRAWVERQTADAEAGLPDAA